MMRLLLPGYLILLLGLFLVATTAHASSHSYQYQAYQACVDRMNSNNLPYGPHPNSCAEPTFYDDGGTYKGSYTSIGCASYAGRNCTADEAWAYGDSHYWRYNTSCGEGETLNEQTGQCETVCEAPNYVDVVTGECVQVQEPEECFENGQIYSPESKTCVADCPDGTLLDGYCLLPEDPDNECSPGSDDYQTSYGTGNNQVHICATTEQECKDNDGTFGIVNGEATCLPDGFGADTVCDQGSIGLLPVNDGYGFVCEKVDGYPGDEEDDEEPEPNTDTDGDGEPDEYDRTNDPDAGNKQRDEIIDQLNDSNRHLENIDNRLKGITENGIPGTGGGGSGGDGGDSGQEGGGVCDTAPELCEGVGNIEDALNAEPDSPAAEPGSFDMDAVNGELEAVKGELESQLDSIKGELETYFDFSPSGGDMTCPYSVDAMDTTLSICPDVYKEELAVIGTVLLALSILASVIIMLR